jgi:hypothetical protein
MTKKDARRGTSPGVSIASNQSNPTVY